MQTKRHTLCRNQGSFRLKANKVTCSLSQSGVYSDSMQTKRHTLCRNQGLFLTHCETRNMLSVAIRGLSDTMQMSDILSVAIRGLFRLNANKETYSLSQSGGSFRLTANEEYAFCLNQGLFPTHCERRDLLSVATRGPFRLTANEEYAFCLNQGLFPTHCNSVTCSVSQLEGFSDTLELSNVPCVATKGSFRH